MYGRLSFEAAAQMHLAQALALWDADRLGPAVAALNAALNAGIQPGNLYDIQRTIEAEYAARRQSNRHFLHEQLFYETVATEPFGVHCPAATTALMAWEAITSAMSVRWGRPVLVAILDPNAMEFMHARYGYYRARDHLHKVCLPASLRFHPHAALRGLRHEIAHAAVQEIGRGRIPRWFDEGVAVWMEEPTGSRSGSTQGYIALSELQSSLGSYGLDLGSRAAEHLYVGAGEWVQWLEHQSGVGTTLAVLREAGAGRTFDQAIGRVTRQSLGRLEACRRKQMARG